MIDVRRLRPGDESVVLALAVQDPPDATRLLSDERTFYVAALDGERPIGLAFAHELLRRHGDPTMLFVYDIGVDEAYRRRGVATRLVRELEAIARERGIRTGFVLTNASNDAAMALYRSLGGERPNDDDVMWDFDYAAG
jgi:ribosomal protein S18 acetylase RimI-like enzyme